MHMYRLVSPCFLFVVAFQSVDCRAQDLQRWIHPGFAQLDSSLHEDETQYPTALREGDVYQFFLDDVDNLGATGPGMTSLQARIAIYKKHGIRISVEAIGLNVADGANYNPGDPDTLYCQKPGIVCGTGPGQVGPVALGQESARTILRKIKPIYDAFGEVIYKKAGKRRSDSGLLRNQSLSVLMAERSSLPPSRACNQG